MSAFFSEADVKEGRFRLGPNVCFRPEADVAYLGGKVRVNTRRATIKVVAGGALAENLDLYTVEIPLI